MSTRAALQDVFAELGMPMPSRRSLLPSRMSMVPLLPSEANRRGSLVRAEHRGSAPHIRLRPRARTPSDRPIDRPKIYAREMADSQPVCGSIRVRSSRVNCHGARQMPAKLPGANKNKRASLTPTPFTQVSTSWVANTVVRRS